MRTQNGEPSMFINLILERITTRSVNDINTEHNYEMFI